MIQHLMKNGTSSKKRILPWNYFLKNSWTIYLWYNNNHYYLFWFICDCVILFCFIYVENHASCFFVHLE
jgi:hypothetical protein